MDKFKVDIFSVVIFVFGILSLIIPKHMFMFGRSWQFNKGSEPSKLAIYMQRLAGLLITVSILFNWVRH